MRAQIGPDDLEMFQEPLVALLAEVSGIQPEPAGLHVLLDTHGVASTQRLALSGFRGGLVIALWPGELKTQAEYLYGQGLGSPMVAAARERGWTATGNPHLAFRNAAASQRLYMTPSVDAREYARRWEEGDLANVGAHWHGDVTRRLWPWLKRRGYADADDDETLQRWLNKRLGNRPALLRPGLQLKRHWSRNEIDAASGLRGLPDAIRADVNAILAAANEPVLPAFAGRSEQRAH